MTLHFTNTLDGIPSAHALKNSFYIFADPETDIWAAPPNTNLFNAPILHRIVRMDRFRSARVKVEGEWSMQSDQGGLLIGMHDATGHQVRKWVKTGIEFVDGKPHVSAVSKDRWADLSLSPVPEAASAAAAADGKSVGVTFEMVKENGSLRIYVVDAEEVKTPIRKVTWAFVCAFEWGDPVDLWIGVYAARPNKETTNKLRVKFSNWNMDIED